MWETKVKEMLVKIKCPYNLQPTGKYLRQAEYNVPPGSSQQSQCSATGENHLRLTTASVSSSACQSPLGHLPFSLSSPTLKSIVGHSSQPQGSSSFCPPVLSLHSDKVTFLHQRHFKNSFLAAGSGLQPHQHSKNYITPF